MINFNSGNSGLNLHKEKYEEKINKLKTQNFELIKFIENVKYEFKEDKSSDKDMEIQRLKNSIKLLKKKKIVKAEEKIFFFFLIKINFLIKKNLDEKSKFEIF